MKAKLFFILAMILTASMQAKSFFCEGEYKGHLQGMTTDGKSIWWSFTVAIVKTDAEGKIIAETKADNHQGDLCWHDGKIYVAVNRGAFNRETGHKDFIYVFDADTLELLQKHPILDEYGHGAGAIAYHDGYLWLTGGLPKGHENNIVCQYTLDLKLVKRHLIPHYTNMGVQTINFAFGRWWFGVYDKPAQFTTDPNFGDIKPGGSQRGLAVGFVVLEDETVIIGSTPSRPDPDNPKRKLWKGKGETATFVKDTGFVLQK